ncbi:MAG: TOBE domain-containing protein, partial [Candidatus Binatia bacterium]
VVVFVRAEAIELASGLYQTCDRVLLQGNVVDVSLRVSHRRITLDCGDFPLVAVVERKNGLEVSLGSDITASFNAAAVHVIASEKER